MEDLTNQVEIIFHPDSSHIDPTDSSVIRLEPIDNEQPSTSRAANASDRIFKIPAVPLRIVRDQALEAAAAPEAREVEMMDMEHEADSDNDEWEETLIYVDLDDIPNVQELFAHDPDDFLLSQSKRHREEVPKVKKAMRPKINLKFFNLDDDHPILQIGDRFYMGKYEEPFGTDLFFREKVEGDQEEEIAQAERDPLRENQPPPKTVLRSLIPEPDPPLNPVFGNHKYCSTDYELVAKVHKVLKMTRRNVMRRDKEDEQSVTKESSARAVPNSSMIRTTVEEINLDEQIIVGITEETSTNDTRTEAPVIHLSPEPQPKEFVPHRTVDLSLGLRKPSSLSTRMTHNSKAHLKGGQGQGDSHEDGHDDSD